MMPNREGSRALRRSGMVVALVSPLIVLSLGNGAPRIAAAATIVVTTTTDELNGDGDCSLREAVAAANSDAAVDACAAGSGDDTINVPDGVYLLPDSQLTISGSVTISGASTNGTIIDGNHAHIVFGIDSEQGFRVEFTGLTVRNGNAATGGGNGGGIWAGGTNTVLTLDHVAITGNVAPGFEGGLAIGSTGIITNSTISGNSAGQDAGAFIARGVVISDSTISDNTAGVNGGAIRNDGPLALSNVTMSGNEAGADGGAIYNSATVTMNGVTVTNNAADSDGDGTGEGGGIFNNTGLEVTVANTIIAANQGPSQSRDCAGELTSRGYNLVGTPDGCTISGDQTGNLVGVDPQLGPLQDNGGSTPTHAPLAGSPAIDAGNPSPVTSSDLACSATDQRGTVRPQDGNADGVASCDIGAVELGGAASQRLPDPIPALIERGEITVGLETVAGGFTGPVTATSAPDDKRHLFVAEQNGKIWSVAIDGGHGDGHHDGGDDRHGHRGRHDGHDRRATPRLFADLGPQGLNLGCFFVNYDERGLFGLAFHPNYKTNGLVYTYQSQPHQGAPKLDANQCDSTFPDHDNVITEWRVNNPRSDHATIDPSSGREILRVAHAQFNHNGGELRFGPDGKLYVSIGDGGNADDQGPGHAVPDGNAQDLSTLLGKVLRIDPMSGSNVAGYSVPADNPFVNTPGARREIWALGFRNPYKMSFDSKTGDLYVADVGQNDVEEIDVVERGMNYGWPIKEGTFAFEQNGADAGFVTANPVTGEFVDPIAEYDHCKGPVDPALVGPCPLKEGIATVGGFVYRGKAIKELRGHYVFGDYSTDFFADAGRLFYLDDHNQVKEFRLEGPARLGLVLLGIGQDASGELYVLGKSGAVPGNAGITDPTNKSGVIRRLTRAHHDDDD